MKVKPSAMGKNSPTSSSSASDVPFIWRFIYRGTLVSIGLLFAFLLLWGLFVPPPHDATVPAKALRVKADMRSVAIALEAYAAYHGAYPAWSGSPRRNAFALSRELRDLKKFLVPSFAFADDSGLLLYHLTTPIAYLPEYPLDPFAEDRYAVYAYWSTGEGVYPGRPSGGWIVWSCGPDGDYDLTTENVSRAYNPAVNEPIPNPILLGLTYDPTNGSVSNGDIYRTRQ